MQRRFALIGHVHTLSDITDLDITGVADNNLLQYDAATLSWTNRTYLALEEISDPGLADANEAWLHAEDVAGFTQVHHNVSDRKWTVSQDNYIVCRNTSGGSMTVGQAVYVTGTTGQRPEIGLADADLHNHSLGLVADAAANNAYTRVVTHGYLTAVDTSAWTEGTKLYLSGTAGSLTSTAPTHPAAAQGICTVIYQHAVNGILFVSHHEDSRETDGSWADTFSIGSAAADRAVLDITTSALSASRSFTFPNASGKFALVDLADQTFTGWQIFSAGLGVTNGYVEITNASATAELWFEATAADADEAWWGWGAYTGGVFRLSTSNDAGTTIKTVLEFNRNGNVVDTITYGNSTDDPTHQFNGPVELLTDGYFLIDEHASSAGTPASGKVALYAKSDGLLYSKDDAGTETLVSGGAGGGAATMDDLYEQTIDFDDITTTLAGTDATEWKVATSGAGAAITLAASEAGHPGIINLSTGTDAAGAAESGMVVALGTAMRTHFLHATDEYNVSFLVRFPTLPDGTNTYSFAAGLRDINTYVNRISVGIRWDGAAAKWRLNTTAASTTTSADGSSAPAANTWYHIKLVATTASVKMYVNGTLEATNSTNIPTAGMALYFNITKTAGTTARTADVDFCHIKRAFATPRFTE